MHTGNPQFNTVICLREYKIITNDRYPHYDFLRPTDKHFNNTRLDGQQ